MAGGNEFHNCGAAAVKDLSPRVSRISVFFFFFFFLYFTSYWCYMYIDEDIISFFSMALMKQM